MTNLQFFNSQKHLLDLICLGPAFLILDIYPWVTWPRRLVSSKTAFLLTWFVSQKLKMARNGLVVEATG
jgi:hypothetical protein